MLIPNCLFRIGGAAMLLSNKRSDYRRAKYTPCSPALILQGMMSNSPIWISPCLTFLLST